MLRRPTGIRDLGVQMPRALRHLTWILALAALGCQQNAPRVGQRTTIQFGTVTAVDTVRQWKFVPARQGERAIAAWVIVPITFTLDG